MYTWNMTTVAATTFRNNFSTTMDALSKDMEYMLVTSRGKVVSALVNIDFFEDLMASKNQKYKDEIRKSREEAKKGNVYTFEEVFGDI